MLGKNVVVWWNGAHHGLGVPKVNDEGKLGLTVQGHPENGKDPIVRSELKGVPPYNVAPRHFSQQGSSHHHTNVHMVSTHSTNDIGGCSEYA